MTDEVGIKLGDLEMIIAEEDGYSADSNAETLLWVLGCQQFTTTSSFRNSARHAVSRASLPSTLW